MLAAFVPQFVCEEKLETGHYLVMHNLLDGFVEPAVLDLKMGTRTWTKHMSAERGGTGVPGASPNADL